MQYSFISTVLVVGIMSCCQSLVSSLRIIRTHARSMLLHETTTDVPVSLSPIEVAKEFISTKLGTEKPGLLSESFQYFSPDTSLNKSKFLANKQREYSFIQQSLADYDLNGYDYSIDDKDPQKVWVKLRPNGKFIKPLVNGKETIPPKNELLLFPVEMVSVTVQGSLVTKATGDFIVDRLVGNTKGLPGSKGLLFAAGNFLY